MSSRVHGETETDFCIPVLLHYRTCFSESEFYLDFTGIWQEFSVGLGIASALIQLVINWAQRMVDPSQAAIIYAG